MRQPWCKILEKDGKVTVGIFMLYFFRTRLNEAEIANLPFAKDTRTFIGCPEFYLSLKISGDFPFSISQESITYILGQSTLRFCRLCRVKSFLRLYGFCIKWKIYAISIIPMILMLREICSNTTSNETKLVVYADNLSAPGRYSE